MKAIVKVKEESQVTTDDVLRHCREHLEGFMVPKIVEFRGSLPRTTSGKVDKQSLKAVAS